MATICKLLLADGERCTQFIPFPTLEIAHVCQPTRHVSQELANQLNYILSEHVKTAGSQKVIRKLFFNQKKVMELITRLEPSNEKVYCLRHGFATTLSCKQNCFCGKLGTNFVTTLKLILITRYHYCQRQILAKNLKYKNRQNLNNVMPCFTHSSTWFLRKANYVVWTF